MDNKISARPDAGSDICGHPPARPATTSFDLDQRRPTRAEASFPGIRLVGRTHGRARSTNRGPTLRMDLVRVLRTSVAVVISVAVAVMPATAGALAAAGATRDAPAAKM